MIDAIRRKQAGRRSAICVLALLIVLAAAPLRGDAPSAAGDQSIRLPRCLVSVVDEVRVPAMVAGVLVELNVREGAPVRVGDVIARVDDSLAKIDGQIAQAEKNVAQARAANDVDVRYARAARDVAQAEYELNEVANQKVPGTKSLIEMKKLQLVVQQATLQIEHAEHQAEVNRHEVAAAAGRLAMAQERQGRHEIRAPLDSEVVERSVRRGEWVEPGQTIMRLVRLDTLRVEGFLNAAEHLPASVHGKPVRVTVQLAAGRSEMFEGRVVFVSPLVEAGGNWRVWAEVANRRDEGHWLLRPGLEAEMTVLVSDSPPAEAR